LVATPYGFVVGYHRFVEPSWFNLECEGPPKRGILPQHYTVSQPRRPRLESSPPWKLQISQHLSLLLNFKGNVVEMISFSNEVSLGY
jgi:hypothetical protein